MMARKQLLGHRVLAGQDRPGTGTAYRRDISHSCRSPASAARCSGSIVPVVLSAPNTGLCQPHEQTAWTPASPTSWMVVWWSTAISSSPVYDWAAHRRCHARLAVSKTPGTSGAPQPPWPPGRLRSEPECLRRSCATHSAFSHYSTALAVVVRLRSDRGAGRRELAEGVRPRCRAHRAARSRRQSLRARRGWRGLRLWLLRQARQRLAWTAMATGVLACRRRMRKVVGDRGTTRQAPGFRGAEVR